MSATIENLELIFETDLSDSSLELFLSQAQIFVSASSKLSTLNSDVQDMIVLYLAAHFASVRDQRLSEVELGDRVGAKYQGKTGMGLESTYYGQTAIILDTTGYLKNLGKNKASISIYPVDYPEAKVD